jgi:hypothetical protein
MIYKIQHTDLKIISIESIVYSDDKVFRDIIDPDNIRKCWINFFDHSSNGLVADLYINLEKYKNMNRNNYIDHVLNLVTLYNRSKRIKSILNGL